MGLPQQRFGSGALRRSRNAADTNPVRASKKKGMFFVAFVPIVLFFVVSKRFSAIFIKIVLIFERNRSYRNWVKNIVHSLFIHRGLT